MDISKFEQFTKTGTKLSNNNISINKAHNFGFNSGFYHRSGIKNFKFVVLYFNKQENSIGFYFLTNEVGGRFTITHSENKTSGV